MQVLLTQARLAKWLPEATEWALWEVMENVLNHAEAPMGWVQAATYSKSKHVNIVVVDCGRGIAASLRRRYGNLSDQRAIKQAVEKGGTSDPDRNAGYGLTGCVEITKSNGGQMTVVSGNYRLLVDVPRRSNAPPVFHYSRERCAHPGSIVELELRTDRPVDLASALGQTSPLTLMELRHDSDNQFAFDIASEAPDVGTRQSGRGVRLKVLNLAQAEPDERIILDFSGVPMLSSSFADELIAKLAVEVGKVDFTRRFKLEGMTPSVKTIVEATLWDRLKQ
jgi:hypothetical protein